MSIAVTQSSKPTYADILKNGRPKIVHINYEIKKQNNFPKKKYSKKACFFCGEVGHLCRDCPKEKKLAPHYKLLIGKKIEEYVGSNYKCPECKGNLSVLGNHTPSLDIVCKNCDHKIEVKSKCMSCKKIPYDLVMKHGTYKHYKKMSKNQLSFVFVIYKVNRIDKSYQIRQVLYASNDKLTNGYVRVVKNCNNHLSTIHIDDSRKLERWWVKNISRKYYVAL